MNVRRVLFRADRFFIPEPATGAFEVWSAAVRSSRSYFPDAFIEPQALTDAMRCSPLPVIELGDGQERPRFGVIGRFNLYQQLIAYAAIDAYRPIDARLSVVRPPAGEGWDDRRLESLAQAMLIVDACGRGMPIHEFREICYATRPNRGAGWSSLTDPRPTRGRLADKLGCLKSQLRYPPTRRSSGSGKG